MAKITLATLTSGYASIAQLNTNNTAIATAIENTLSRDGTSPNAMGADFDMNSKDILNADVVNAQSVIISGTSVVPGDTLTVPGASSVPNTPAGDIVAVDVQSALNELDDEKARLAGGNTITGAQDLTGATLAGASPLVFEGATADAFETSFLITDPTADRVITFPDSSITISGDPMTTRGDLVHRNAANAIDRLAVGAAGTVLKSDGTDPSWGSASGDDTAYAASWNANTDAPTKNAVYDRLELMGSQTQLLVVKASDESVTSSTTLQDDDEFTQTLVANKLYTFESMLIITTATAVPDFKWQWIETDGTYDFKYTYWASDAATATASASDTSSVDNINIGAGVRSLIYVVGIIQTGGSGGAFKLQWAQNTSDATATIVKANSYMKATQLN